MKKIIKFLILILISTSFNSCENDDEINIENQSVKNYSSSISDFNAALTNYVVMTQKCEASNFNKMSVNEIENLMHDYITAVEVFIDAYNYTYEFNQNTAKATQNKLSGNCFATVSGGVPLSPVLPYQLGNTIKDANDKTAKNEEDHDSGKKNDYQYKDDQHSIVDECLTDLKNIGAASVSATGAVLITASALAAMASPPGWIATATILITVGATTGSSVLWYMYSDTEDSGEKKGGKQKYTILTGKTTVGGSIPIHLFPDNSNVVIAIEGYAPVTLKNFKLPKTGINKIIEVEGVKLKDAEWGGTSVVCLSEEKMTTLSCTDVQFVNASAYPANPAPGQGVTVTASLIPIAANCDIKFSITGTDGYSKSTTTASNNSGQATFYIPGGEKNTVDVVNITSSNGKTYTVTYVF